MEIETEVQLLGYKERCLLALRGSPSFESSLMLMVCLLNVCCQDQKLGV